MNLTKRTIALGMLIGLVAGGLVACGGDDSNDSDNGGAGAAGAGGSAVGGTGGSAQGGTGGSAQGGTGGSAQGGTGGSAQGGSGQGGSAQGGSGQGGSAQGGSGQGGSAGQSLEGTDCAHAIDYMANADPQDGTVAGTIDPAGDADFYKIDLEADKFYIFATEANPDDEDGKLDTVITLFSADGSKRIATMDDAYPRFSTDSQLIYHSPKAQTVCVKIEDWSTWAGETPEGDSSFVYKFSVGMPKDDAELNNHDTESNDDIDHAQAATFMSGTQSKSTFGQFYGTFKDGNDVDVFKFTPTADTVSVSVEFTPHGPGDAGKDKAKSGNGSTEGLGLVKITTADGIILGMLDVSKGSDSMNIPIEAPSAGNMPELFLHIPRADSTVGDNDFYSLFQINSDIDNPGETDDTSNNTLAGADTLNLEADSSDPKQKSAFILGHIPSGDKDYFKFSASQGDKVALACGAARSGSGLRWATFAIKKSDDTTMQEETETDTADVLWTQYSNASKPPIDITETGDYYLFVTASGQDDDNTADFYRCGLYVTSP